ncbi:hypothetical protein FA95DRAFT_1561949 [Auriscalpium vulgare]|uniref:Uncharacterized protein n=1 Tax=Auriscalpium vulgare TaxID=40419 RepID=A0ACB8RLX3_9AGAM|nr:hypothetical protein FA95DRAFT_1561949 [Auriscalpium vulgare]
MTQDLIRQQNLHATSGKARAQSDQRTEPQQSAPTPRITFSFVAPSGAPSNGPNVAEGGPNYVYIGTYTTRNDQTLEMQDPATGMLTPTVRVTTESDVNGGLSWGDRSGVPAEEAETVPKPNAPGKHHAHPDTDASADTSVRLSSDAASDGPSLDTRDLYIECIDSVALDSYQEVGSYRSDLGDDPLFEGLFPRVVLL